MPRSDAFGLDGALVIDSIELFSFSARGLPERSAPRLRARGGASWQGRLRF
jgi:hypothetical protein